MRSGGVCSGPSATMSAPIFRNGSMMRSIGRRVSDGFPINRVSKVWPASKPASKRMVVPEPPQSSSCFGGVRTRFLPCTVNTSGSGCSIWIPSAQRIDRMHAVVARQKSAQGADAVGERGDNGGAMRITFVARDSDFRLDPRRSFYAQLHKEIKEKRCRIQYLAFSIGRNCRYGTRKILFVKGSLTSVPGGKPRTSTSP